MKKCIKIKLNLHRSENDIFVVISRKIPKKIDLIVVVTVTVPRYNHVQITENNQSNCVK